MKLVNRLVAATAVMISIATSSATVLAGGSNGFQYPTVAEGTFTINSSKQAQKHINPGDLTTLVAESDRLYSAKGCTVGVAVNMPRKYTCSSKVISLTYGLGNNYTDVYMTWTQQ